MDFFPKLLFEDPLVYFGTVGFMLLSISIHEFCHAFVAHKLGDDTAHAGGLMVINPLKTMGWLSLACVFLFGVGWGCVYVNEKRLTSLKKTAVIAAGPFSHFLLAVLFSMLLRWMDNVLLIVPETFLHGVARVLCWGCFSNLFLCFLNILPFYPFDGGRILDALVPRMQKISDTQKKFCTGVFCFLLYGTPLFGIFLRTCLKVTEWFLGLDLLCYSLF